MQLLQKRSVLIWIKWDYTKKKLEIQFTEYEYKARIF